MEMVAAQAHHRDDRLGDENEETIAADEKLGDDEKREILQRNLTMAASNGDIPRIKRLVGGTAKPYVDVNKPDEDGTVPLIYASCFVRVLLPHIALCLMYSGPPRSRLGTA